MNKKKFTIKELPRLLIDSVNQFIDDKGLKMAAALSYYTAFSIGPMLLIVISFVGLFFGEDNARIGIVNEANKLIGTEGANMLNTIIKGASNTSTGIFAAIMSIVLLILGAVTVFIELQESLNIIWGIELKPGRGIRNFIRTRIVSFSMVIASSFVLMVSLIADSVLTLLNKYIGDIFPSIIPTAEIYNYAGSFLIITILFALIFKYLPNVRISWKYVWIGALVTSFLFFIGKYLIGLYLGRSSYSSTYGAAASFIILFVWIYYSGVILYLGAEITYLYRIRYGLKPIEADKEGIRVTKISELIKESFEKSQNKIS
ncbi:MAG: YihY/virulence factor BrkB family protein [Ignavibacteria bacterium]|nr:YihY/virulence factor BrkB family protein [Ignavibacteria bacterium]